MDKLPYLKPFYVTWDHLQKGKCKNPYECALAIALKDAVPHSSVRIENRMFCSHMTIIYGAHDFMTARQEIVRLDLSPTVSMWMRCFDLKLKLAPTVLFLFHHEQSNARVLTRIDLEEDEGLKDKVNWREVNDREEKLYRPTQVPESGTPGREADYEHTHGWSPKANE